LALSKEYSSKGICTASKKYQEIKLERTATGKEQLTENQFQKRKEDITEKACLCVGLVNSAYMELDLEIKGRSRESSFVRDPILLFLIRKFSFGNGTTYLRK
jgi:hypothetical protein